MNLFEFNFTDLKIILRDFGEIISYFSVAFILPIVASLIYMEGLTVLSYYLVPLAASIGVGYSFKKLFDVDRSTEKVHAFTMVILVWFIVPLFGAVPYMMHGMETPSPIGLSDAYFDSVSAFTTTGSTPIREQGLYPNSLMFWRSVQAWVGGAGLIILALVGIFTYVKSYKLYRAEGREERLRPSVKGTAKRIWWVYILLTTFGVILLLLSGLTLFESVNYSMSAISTNGMDMAWTGLRSMNNVLAEASLVVIMLLGSFSFYIHYMFLKGKWKAYLGDIQVKLTFILLFLGISLTLPQFIGIYGTTDGFRYSAFHVTSALTAGGFHAVSGIEWGETIKFVLMSLMIVGGSAGSTAGGLKMIRLWIFLKSIYWKIKESILPDRAYFSRKIEGEEATDKELSTIYVFILLYLLFIAMGALVITYSEGDVAMGDAMFATASAQGNAGLMVGVVEPTMSMASKTMLIFNMVVGRIEIIPIIYGVGFLLKYKKKPSLSRL